MSVLTYKILHNRDFSEELGKALRVANYSLKHRKCRTTKDVSYIGLKACIANQILKKYGSNKKIKKVNRIKLTINGFFVKVDKETKELSIPSLKLKLNYQFPNDFKKLVQVELDHKYLYASVEVEDAPAHPTTQYLGVDRNTTGHCVVVAIPQTGKVYKLGKKNFHIHRKYKKIRSHLQAANAKKALKKISRKESNIIRDCNHKISRKVVELAQQHNCGIKLEDLRGIRGGKRAQNTKKNKSGESFKSSINTWEFYQQELMIIYKAKICGIPVIKIAPQFTSQKCSKCGLIGDRNGKSFKCHNCGHVDHADANAAFNIAAVALSNTHIESNDQSLTDRDVNEGSTDTPKIETQMHMSAFA